MLFICNQLELIIGWQRTRWHRVCIERVLNFKLVSLEVKTLEVETHAVGVHFFLSDVIEKLLLRLHPFDLEPFICKSDLWVDVLLKIFNSVFANISIW